MNLERDGHNWSCSNLYGEDIEISKDGILVAELSITGNYTFHTNPISQTDLATVIHVVNVYDSKTNK